MKLYYYKNSQYDQPVGPVTREALASLFQYGHIRRETLICDAGGIAWYRYQDMAVMSRPPAEKNWTFASCAMWSLLIGFICFVVATPIILGLFSEHISEVFAGISGRLTMEMAKDVVEANEEAVRLLGDHIEVTYITDPDATTQTEDRTSGRCHIQGSKAKGILSFTQNDNNQDFTVLELEIDKKTYDLLKSGEGSGKGKGNGSGRANGEAKSASESEEK